MAPDQDLAVQVFGYRDSRPTQHALRFFRERTVATAFVDLAQRRLARGELARFVAKFGAARLLDESSRAFADAGLAWLRLADEQIVERLLADPRLLRLPLVRAGTRFSVGHDEPAWRGWLGRP